MKRDEHQEPDRTEVMRNGERGCDQIQRYYFKVHFVSNLA